MEEKEIEEIFDKSIEVYGSFKINGKEIGYPEKTVSTLFHFLGSGANYSGASARSLSLKNSDVSI